MGSICYDPVAEIYDITRLLSTQEMTRIVESLILKGNLRKKSRILEAGVGTGRVAIELAKDGFHVTGIDISGKMLAQLQKKGAKRVTPIRADAALPPFRYNSFDCIYAVHLLHLVPGWRLAIKDLFRALKPKGRLMVLFYPNDRPPTFDQIRQALEGILKEKKYSLQAPGAENWSQIYSEMRLYGDVQKEIFNTVKSVSTIRDELTKFRAGTNSRTWAIPDKIMNAAVDTLESKFEKLHGLDMVIEQKSRVGWLILEKSSRHFSIKNQ